MNAYEIYAYRKPTPEEIRFGYGCPVYSTFTLLRKTAPKKFKWVGNWWTVETIKIIPDPRQHQVREAQAALAQAEGK